MRNTFIYTYIYIYIHIHIYIYIYTYISIVDSSRIMPGWLVPWLSCSGVATLASSSSDSEDDFHTVPREDLMPPVPADVDDSIPADMATLGVPLEAPPWGAGAVSIPGADEATEDNRPGEAEAVAIPGADQKASEDNLSAEAEAVATPEADESSEDSLSADEAVPQLRRSARNRQAPVCYRDGTYVLFPQIASGREWKAGFDVLWNKFPDKRQDIYQRLLNDVSLAHWRIVRDDNFSVGGRMLHPGIMGLILYLGLVCLIPYHVIPHPVVAMVTRKYVFIIWFYNRTIWMSVECLVMNETIPVFCLVIFPIWHNGKIPFTRAIQIVRVFPAGPLGIRN